MSFSALFVLCVCDLISGSCNPDIEAGHQNSGHEALGIVEDRRVPLQRSKPGDSLSSPFTMVVESVTFVVLATMGRVLAPTGLTGASRVHPFPLC